MKKQKWVNGIVNNMARKSSGSDTDQIYDTVAASERNIAIVNNYYFTRILASENKKNILNKLEAFFPK